MFHISEIDVSVDKCTIISFNTWEVRQTVYFDLFCIYSWYNKSNKLSNNVCNFGKRFNATILHKL